MTRLRPSSRPVGPVAAVLLAWLASVAFDLFLHGGLLHDLYLGSGDPFLLDPADAFRRIPAGYAAFLLLTVALWWLLRRLEVRGAREGARYGTVAGGVVWGALVLGLWSITRAEVTLLLAWWVGQALELGLAGAVLGAARDGVAARRLGGVVAVLVTVLVAAAVVLQNLG